MNARPSRRERSAAGRVADRDAGSASDKSDGERASATAGYVCPQHQWAHVGRPWLGAPVRLGFDSPDGHQPCHVAA